MRIIDGPIYEGKDATLGEKAERAWEVVHRASGIALLNDRKCGSRRRSVDALWTVQRAEAEVRLLVSRLNLGDAYPTPIQLKNVRGLRKAIHKQFGGHPAFADSLGLKMRRDPREGWTIERAEAQVSSLVAKLDLGDIYPSVQQFEDNGLAGLQVTVYKRLGGHPALADNLGLKMKQDPRKGWTIKRAEIEVSSLVAKLNLGDFYPSRAQFEDNELRGLYCVIRKRLGGHPALADSLGLKMRRDPRKGWTAERAEAEVSSLAARLNLGGSYPSCTQFEDNELGSLWTIIHRRLGGHPALADSLGLKMQRDPRERWTAKRAEAEVLSLVARLNLGDIYPTPSQFRNNGLWGLYQAIIARLGGNQEFACHLDLTMTRQRTSANVSSGCKHP